MKRIFKLRSELTLCALIVIVIMAIFEFIMREMILGPFFNSPQNVINYIYHVSINKVEASLKSVNLNEDKEAQNALNKFGYKLNSYIVFIVDKDGKVSAANNAEIKTIDNKEIINGKRKFTYINDSKSAVRITGCDYLKDGWYLYYIYEGYGSIDELASSRNITLLIIFSIVFFLIIWKRISYISTIKKTVSHIAHGDLSQRVPLKYKNELRELAEEINFMASEMEKEDKKRSEFLTNISHDLRTPLTTIIGYIDMIKKERYVSKNELNSYIDIMNKKGLYLRNMLENFFQYSKISSKDILLEKQRLELNELARQIHEEEEDEFMQENLQISLKLFKECIYINADTKLLLRAINNLLSNALKYSKRNTEIEFVITREKHNNIFYGVILVSNISEEEINESEIASFFERLYKKDLSRNKEGSGLGLSIVKDIVKLHDGFAKAYKEKDRLFFKIYIKCKELS